MSAFNQQLFTDQSTNHLQFDKQCATCFCFSLHYLIFASNAQFDDFIAFYPISVPKHKYLLLSHFHTLANIYVYSNVYFIVIYIYIGKYMLIA